MLWRVLNKSFACQPPQIAFSQARLTQLQHVHGELPKPAANIVSILRCPPEHGQRLQRQVFRQFNIIRSQTDAVQACYYLSHDAHRSKMPAGAPPTVSSGACLFPALLALDLASQPISARDRIRGENIVQSCGPNSLPIFPDLLILRWHVDCSSDLPITFASKNKA